MEFRGPNKGNGQIESLKAWVIIWNVKVCNALLKNKFTLSHFREECRFLKVDDSFEESYLIPLQQKLPLLHFCPGDIGDLLYSAMESERNGPVWFFNEWLKIAILLINTDKLNINIVQFKTHSNRKSYYKHSSSRVIVFFFQLATRIHIWYFLFQKSMVSLYDSKYIKL